MATNNKTFASRAKALIKKYKGANYDPIQKKELEDELDKLAQEQEAYKQANGIGVQQDDSQQTFDVGGEIPYSTSITPALISGATSMIGNLVLGSMAGKRNVNYATIKPSQMAAEQISLAGQRNQIARDASIANSTGMRNAGTAARTRGEYMGNVGNMVVGLNQNVADAYSNSYQTEQLTNAQARQQAAQFNAQNKMAVDQYNNNIKNSAYKQQLANKAEQADYISAAIESIPSTMQNIEQIKQFDAALAVSAPRNSQLVMTPTNRKAYELWKKKYNVGLKFKKQYDGKTD